MYVDLRVRRPSPAIVLASRNATYGYRGMSRCGLMLVCDNFFRIIKCVQGHFVVNVHSVLARRANIIRGRMIDNVDASHFPRKKGMKGRPSTPLIMIPP